MTAGSSPRIQINLRVPSPVLALIDAEAKACELTRTALLLRPFADAEGADARPARKRASHR